MSARSLGFDETRLEHLVRTIEADVARERYDGAAVLVARRGEIALHEAVGFAERASERKARTDDVFCLFSVTKTFTSAAVLARVDRGEIQLTTPIAEVLPEFGVKGKQRVNVGHLLTQRGGMSSELPPIPIDKLGDLETVAAAVCDQPLLSAPGKLVSYSPIGAHAVLGELVRRLDGGSRSFREILADEIFGPLGMKDTALGVRADLAARRVPIVVRDRSPGLFVPELLEALNADPRRGDRDTRWGRRRDGARRLPLRRGTAARRRARRGPDSLAGAARPGDAEPHRVRAQSPVRPHARDARLGRVPGGARAGLLRARRGAIPHALRADGLTPQPSEASAPAPPCSG